MRKCTLILFVLIISLMLCSCSMQRSVDIYEFSNRLFKLLDEEPYEPSAYYYDGNSRYSYFLSISQTRTAVITLSTNEDLSVKSFEITLTKEGLPVTAEQQEYIYRLFVCACSVLTQQNAEALSEEFNSNGLTKEIIDFTNLNLPFETDTQSIFVFSNSEIISLYTEII